MFRFSMQGDEERWHAFFTQKGLRKDRKGMANILFQWPNRGFTMKLKRSSRKISEIRLRRTVQ